MTTQILVGDCRQVLSTLADQSVQCCVTSPPYYGLRDYGHPSQIGMETTPEEYIATLVNVFRLVGRVLKDNGTLWVNIGDSYCTRPRGSDKGWDKSRLTNPAQQQKRQRASMREGYAKREWGDVKHKDLLMIPAQLALALRADGWFLRQDIIWAKPNGMPESVTDRCTRSHEYMFLLSKRPRYYYDHKAIQEPLKKGSLLRLDQNLEGQEGSRRANGATRSDRPFKPVTSEGRANKRDVWTVATQPYKGAHYATFPPKLIEPCIKAGSALGDTVLDPFGGSGTVAMVAANLGRNAILIDLNQSTQTMTEQRLGMPLFTGAANA
jgi:DNA modification methylase